MKKIIFFFTCFLLLSSSIYAQEKHVQEIEYELSNEIEDEHILLPIDSTNLILMNLKIRSFSRKGIVEIKRLNQNLNEEWNSIFEISKEFQIVKYFLDEENLHILLKENDEKKISVLKVNIKTGEYLVFDSALLTNMDVSFFGHLNHKYILAGEYNDRPVAEIHKVIDKTAKVFPQIYGNRQEISSLEIYNSRIYFFVKEKNRCQMMTFVYDTDAKLIEKALIGDKNNVILNVKLVKTPSKSAFFTGNYATFCSEFSTGFFIFKQSNLTDIHFYPFNAFNNYYAHLPEKKQLRLKQRIQQRNVKGKMNVTRARVNLQEPRLINNEIVMLAEIYYPEYKSNVFTSRSLLRLGENYASQKEFNNYRYSNAVICTFDSTSKLTWDYSISMDGLESNVLSQKAHLTYENDLILFAYPKESKIFLKTLKKNEKPVEVPTLNLKKEQNTNISDIKVDLFYWYGKHFVSYGYKTARMGGELLQKEFFYIRKLDFPVEDQKSK
jgi:hypothetical protein